ncbi:FMRFamide receptor [Aplysia californica]|uniref:FMRFamide receptor n=1 Tax=Aplysia californica TaxID=6500 RepID=A0ABM0JKQ5_APLCA|nr:FMRFamide receptor [Aplysia californica]
MINTMGDSNIYQALTTDSSLSLATTFYNNSDMVTSPPMTGNSSSNATKREIIKFWRSTAFGLGGTVVCCIGIICNITAILVLANFKNKSSAPVLLMCLAVSDTAYLTSRMFLETIPSLIFNNYIDPSYRENVLPSVCVMFPAYLVAQCLGIYTVLIITLERYTVIVWPFKAHKMCNLRTSLSAVACLLCLVILYHIPFFFAHECVVKLNNATLTNSTVFQRTDFGLSHFYVHVYYKWINPCVIFAFPFLVLVLFNSMTLHALWRDRQATSAAQNRVHPERRLTVMVLCMTGAFFLFELMAALAFVLTSGNDTYIELTVPLIRFTAISDLGLLTNSAVNFLIYCSTGKKFRDTFRHLACKFVHILCPYSLSPCRKRQAKYRTGHESEVTHATTVAIGSNSNINISTPEVKLRKYNASVEVEK